MRLNERRRYLEYAAANAYPHGRCGSNARWKLKNGELIITGTGDLYDLDSTELGFTQYTNDITYLSISDGITILRARNFKDLSSIEGISFSPSLTNMGNNSTFQGCSALARIDFNGTFTEWNLGTKTSLFAANNSVKYLYCNGVYLPALLELPDVTSIGPSTYRTLGNLETVVIGNNCTSIGLYAFQYCGNLADVTLGNALQTIAADAFSHTALTEIDLPASLTEIGANAFSSTQIATVNYAGNQTQYDAVNMIGSPASGNYRLYCAGNEVENITVNKSFLRSNYRSCRSIKTATLTANVTDVVNQAFINCTNLTTVTILGTPTFGGNGIFSNCTNLTDIYVPWAQGAVAGAPWGARNATIHYNS